MLSIFREASSVDGKPGPISIRRVLSAYFAALSAALFILALPRASAGWWVFIPGAACVVAALLLLFFTTWADVASVARAVKDPGAP